MFYLVDTNIFIHTISNRAYEVSSRCNDINEPVTITKTILSELEPGYYLANDNISAREIYNSVCRLSGQLGLIKIVSFSDISGAKEEFDKIRSRFYSWIYNAGYLRTLIEEHQLEEKDIPKLSHKDLGECELLAIAKATNNQSMIVTNDKGRVYKHPDLNIFSDYKDDKSVIIINGDEWMKNIDFS